MPKSDEFCAGQPDEAILVNQTGCRNNYGDPLICDIGGVATLTGIIPYWYNSCYYPIEAV